MVQDKTGVLNAKTRKLLAVETAAGFVAGLVGALLCGKSWWFVLLTAAVMTVGTFSMLALMAAAERMEKNESEESFF